MWLNVHRRLGKKGYSVTSNRVVCNRWVKRIMRVLLLVSGVLLTIAGAMVWTAPDWLIDTLAERYPGCIYRVRTRERIVALTLDDGPSVSTPLILAELRKHGARATFFLISKRVRGQEPLVRSIVADGHELGNHFSHQRPSIRLSGQEFEEDLLRAHQVLTRFTQPLWARPASGWYTQAMLQTMRRHGYRCALGSIYPFDAAIPVVSWATRYILRNARPGAIIILHDGGSRGRRTAHVLAAVLPTLRKRGYRVVPLSDLFSSVR
jgi:peptidoglycan/xylan/chitin deacetylase (PgdA/CDA1 family)